MPLRVKHLLNVFIIVAISLMADSCQKKHPNCDSNCFDVRISGKIYNQTTGKGLSNEPVGMQWKQKNYCLSCTFYKTLNTKTDNDGRFTFIQTIDSAFFNEYYLEVSTPYNKNYIIKTSAQSLGTTISKTIYNLNTTALQQIDFEYFIKASLNIRMHRMMNDTFNSFNLLHSSGDLYAITAYSVGNQIFAKDTSLIVTTAVNLYTRIISQKRLNYGAVKTKVDSIICTTNTSNVININY